MNFPVGGLIKRERESEKIAVEYGFCLGTTLTIKCFVSNQRPFQIFFIFNFLFISFYKIKRKDKEIMANKQVKVLLTIVKYIHQN